MRWDVPGLGIVSEVGCTRTRNCTGGRMYEGTICMREPATLSTVLAGKRISIEQDLFPPPRSHNRVYYFSF